MVEVSGVSKKLFDAQQIFEAALWLHRGFISVQQLAARYDIMAETGERRAKYRDEQFPKDLQSAYGLGKRLVQKAENDQI